MHLNDVGYTDKDDAEFQRKFNTGNPASSGRVWYVGGTCGCSGFENSVAVVGT